jgi:hypothetical protein
MLLGVDYYLLEDGHAGGVNLGWHPFVPIGLTGLRFIPAISARADVLDVTIGEVSLLESDGHFLAPTGEQFTIGSRIYATGLMVGGEITGGLAFQLSQRLSIFGEAGYRILAGVAEWSFRIEDGGNEVDIESFGVPVHNTDFTVREMVYRFGLSF